MDIQKLKEQASDISEKIRNTPPKTKMIIVGSIAGVFFLVAAYNIYSTFAPAPRAEEPQSADWNIVRELNEALSAKPAFMDAAFHVDESVSPPILKMTGQVKTQKDLAAVKDFVKATKPDVPESRFDYQDVHVVK